MKPFLLLLSFLSVLASVFADNESPSGSRVNIAGGAVLFSAFAWCISKHPFFSFDTASSFTNSSVIANDTAALPALLDPTPYLGLTYVPPADDETVFMERWYEYPPPPVTPAHNIFWPTCKLDEFILAPISDESETVSAPTQPWFEIDFAGCYGHLWFLWQLIRSSGILVKDETWNLKRAIGALLPHHTSWLWSMATSVALVLVLFKMTRRLIRRGFLLLESGLRLAKDFLWQHLRNTFIKLWYSVCDLQNKSTSMWLATLSQLVLWIPIFIDGARGAFVIFVFGAANSLKSCLHCSIDEVYHMLARGIDLGFLIATRCIDLWQLIKSSGLTPDQQKEARSVAQSELAQMLIKIRGKDADDTLIEQRNNLSRDRLGWLNPDIEQITSDLCDDFNEDFKTYIQQYAVQIFEKSFTPMIQNLVDTSNQKSCTEVQNLNQVLYQKALEDLKQYIVGKVRETVLNINAETIMAKLHSRINEASSTATSKYLETMAMGKYRLTLAQARSEMNQEVSSMTANAKHARSEVNAISTTVEALSREASTVRHENENISVIQKAIERRLLDLEVGKDTAHNILMRENSELREQQRNIAAQLETQQKQIERDAKLHATGRKIDHEAIRKWHEFFLTQMEEMKALKKEMAVLKKRSKDQNSQLPSSVTPAPAAIEEQVRKVMVIPDDSPGIPAFSAKKPAPINSPSLQTHAQRPQPKEKENGNGISSNNRVAPTASEPIAPGQPVKSTEPIPSKFDPTTSSRMIFEPPAEKHNDPSVHPLGFNALAGLKSPLQIDADISPGSISSTVNPPVQQKGVHARIPTPKNDFPTPMAYNVLPPESSKPKSIENALQQSQKPRSTMKIAECLDCVPESTSSSEHPKQAMTVSFELNQGNEPAHSAECGPQEPSARSLDNNDQASVAEPAPVEQLSTIPPTLSPSGLSGNSEISLPAGVSRSVFQYHHTMHPNVPVDLLISFLKMFPTGHKQDIQVGPESYGLGACVASWNQQFGQQYGCIIYENAYAIATETWVDALADKDMSADKLEGIFALILETTFPSLDVTPRLAVMADPELFWATDGEGCNTELWVGNDKNDGGLRWWGLRSVGEPERQPQDISLPPSDSDFSQPSPPPEVPVEFEHLTDAAMLVDSDILRTHHESPPPPENEQPPPEQESPLPLQLPPAASDSPPEDMTPLSRGDNEDDNLSEISDLSAHHTQIRPESIDPAFGPSSPFDGYVPPETDVNMDFDFGLDLASDMPRFSPIQSPCPGTASNASWQAPVEDGIAPEPAPELDVSMNGPADDLLGLPAESETPGMDMFNLDQTQILPMQSQRVDFQTDPHLQGSFHQEPLDSSNPSVPALDIDMDPSQDNLIDPPWGSGLPGLGMVDFDQTSLPQMQQPLSSYSGVDFSHPAQMSDDMAIARDDVNMGTTADDSWNLSWDAGIPDLGMLDSEETPFFHYPSPPENDLSQRVPGEVDIVEGIGNPYNSFGDDITAPYLKPFGPADAIETDQESKSKHVLGEKNNQQQKPWIPKVHADPTLKIYADSNRTETRNPITNAPEVFPISEETDQSILNAFKNDGGEAHVEHPALTAVLEEHARPVGRKKLQPISRLGRKTMPSTQPTPSFESVSNPFAQSTTDGQKTIFSTFGNPLQFMGAQEGQNLADSNLDPRLRRVQDHQEALSYSGYKDQAELDAAEAELYDMLDWEPENDTPNDAPPPDGPPDVLPADVSSARPSEVPATSLADMGISSEHLSALQNYINPPTANNSRGDASNPAPAQNIPADPANPATGQSNAFDAANPDPMQEKAVDAANPEADQNTAGNGTNSEPVQINQADGRGGFDLLRGFLRIGSTTATGNDVPSTSTPPMAAKPTRHIPAKDEVPDCDPDHYIPPPGKREPTDWEKVHLSGATLLKIRRTTNYIPPRAAVPVPMPQMPGLSSHSVIKPRYEELLPARSESERERSLRMKRQADEEMERLKAEQPGSEMVGMDAAKRARIDLPEPLEPQQAAVTHEHAGFKFEGAIMIDDGISDLPQRADAAMMSRRKVKQLKGLRPSEKVAALGLTEEIKRQTELDKEEWKKKQVEAEIYRRWDQNRRIRMMKAEEARRRNVQGN